MSLFSSTKITLAMIKFEHTVFALPFALLSALLASEGWPGGPKILWIVVAMVGARSAAMAFNRLADIRIDTLNPRTRTRALPAGHLSPFFVAVFTLASGSVFVLAAYQLNPLCFLPVLSRAAHPAALLLHQAVHAASPTSTWGSVWGWPLWAPGLP